MAWGKVSPEGREVLKQMDSVQRNLRERGQEPLTEEQTSKVINNLVTPADMGKKS